MDNLKVLSLFSGIGAFEKALTNIKVPYDIVNYCEIDKNTAKCYSVIHNVPESKNLVDITKVDEKKLDKDIDLIVHGSPCQDYSLAGKEKGGDEGSGTRSSLLWESVRIIKEVKPKYIVWENVKNVLGPKHIHNFQKYLDTLEKEGYKNYYKVLNAKNFKLPQSRERIFVVSIRKDIKNDFDFKNIKESKKIIPIKDKCFDMSKIEDKYICKRPLILATAAKNKNDIITIGEVSKNSQGGKVYGIDGVFPTICAGVHGYAMGYIYQDSKVRMITPEEVFIFMGFNKKDCKKCRDINMKDTPLYKMGGNSIAVSVLEAIFKELLK